MPTNLKMSQFDQVSDSVSLAKIEGKNFTIVKIEDSNYSQGETVTKGVKVTTKEMFDVDGEDGQKTQQNKFHTTRKTLVNKLNEEKLRSAVNGGQALGPVTCKKVSAKQGGNPYYILVDAV